MDRQLHAVGDVADAEHLGDGVWRQCFLPSNDRQRVITEVLR